MTAMMASIMLCCGCGGDSNVCLVKAQEVSEASVKIGLLEKKLESSSAESKRLVDGEKEEAKKLKDQLDRQKE